MAVKYLEASLVVPFNHLRRQTTDPKTVAQCLLLSCLHMIFNLGGGGGACGVRRRRWRIAGDRPGIDAMPAQLADAQAREKEK